MQLTIGLCISTRNKARCVWMELKCEREEKWNRSAQTECRVAFHYFSKSFSPANVRAFYLFAQRFILFSANLLKYLPNRKNEKSLPLFYSLSIFSATNFISLIMLLLSVALLLCVRPGCVKISFSFCIYVLTFNIICSSLFLPFVFGAAGIVFPFPHVISSAHRCGPRFVAETHAKMCRSLWIKVVDEQRAHHPSIGAATQ